MLVVQRKKDGLYYRGLRSNSGWGREQWTADINDVLPFRNMSAVKNVLRPKGWYGFRERSAHECCKQTKWSYRGFSNKCEHFKEQERADETKFWQQYRVFVVALQTMEEINRGA